MDNNNTPPLLGNSRIISNNAGRYAITLPPYPPAGFQRGVVPGNAVEIVRWTTDENEPQELELLMWFESNVEGSGMADDPKLAGVANFALTKNLGAQGGAGITVDVGLSMPANGLRARFVARNAVLRAWSVTGVSATYPRGVPCVIRAAIYPCAGIVDGPETCLHTGHTMSMVPKGARVFRIVPGAAEPAQSVEFFPQQPTGFFGASDTGTPIASYSNQLAAQWTTIPRGAYWVLINGTWLSPIDARSPYAADTEVYFR